MTLADLPRIAPAIRTAVVGAALATVVATASASEVATGVVLEALENEKRALAEAAASGGVDLLAVAGRATPRDVGASSIDHLAEEDATAAGALDQANPAEAAEIMRATGADAWREFRQAEAKGGEQWRCLAEALYFEARGEGLSGQVAVAEVILNRVTSRSFPGSVCDVVLQGSGRKNACQFSYACDGKPEHVEERDAFQRAGKIARVMIDGRPRVLTGEAIFYHNGSVNPKWNRKLERTAVIGDHIFYRHPVRLSQR